MPRPKWSSPVVTAAAAAVETAVRDGAPVGAVGADSETLTRCDGCTNTLGATGDLGAFGAPRALGAPGAFGAPGATRALGAAGAGSMRRFGAGGSVARADGLPAILSATAVPADAEAPVGAKAGAGLVVACGAGVGCSEGATAGGGLVIGGTIVVEGAVAAGGAAIEPAIDPGSSCRTAALSGAAGIPQYACVIQITAPHKTMAQTTATARYATRRFSRLNGDVGLKRP